MKKFVIQWRKFESKRSSRNEVMNFWILLIFLIFIFIFQVFFTIYFRKKIAKKGLIFAKDPWSWRGTTLTRGGAMRAHVDPMDAHVACWVKWVVCVWAHMYSGPTEGIGGCTRPMRVMQWLKETHLIYSPSSLHLLRVGLMFSLACNVASRGASYEIGQIDAR